MTFVIFLTTLPHHECQLHCAISDGWSVIRNRFTSVIIADQWSTFDYQQNQSLDIQRSFTNICESVEVLNSSDDPNTVRPTRIYQKHETDRKLNKSTNHLIFSWLSTKLGYKVCQEILLFGRLVDNYDYSNDHDHDVLGKLLTFGKSWNNPHLPERPG